ncbi:hypothetical protein AGMMS49960_17680 [Betaproteobacteria bacterium]|nr:hypothetical protein AGMMS49543_03770 [Betaproteobacteria bacterium]GHU03385.1 hypothetical protein AGMMS49960_17680 [Betaproteobacteria bacterium]GHU17834.1 hypothetical protein AGMMS50243_06740 [Betaproteobacteria bacterium]
MAFDFSTLQTYRKTPVTAVTAVQPSNGAGLRVTAGEFSSGNKSEVTGRGASELLPLLPLVPEPAVTGKPSNTNGCTAVTAVTAQKQDVCKITSETEERAQCWRVQSADRETCIACRERYEERAGILEFDAGFTREEAERRALMVARGGAVRSTYRM